MSLQIYVLATVVIFSITSALHLMHRRCFNSIFVNDQQITGITCDENGYIYLAGTGITKQTSYCCTFNEIYLGDLPANMQCQGDITYRDGKFYLVSIGNNLVEVNMKNPSKSTIVMSFPSWVLPIHGLATVQLDCGSSITYATGRESTFSKVYEIDFDPWAVTEVCEVDLSITGASSYSEGALPPCDVFVDLDSDNSSLGFRGNYCSDTICTPPVSVADTDVVILSSSGAIDSITFELYQTLDGVNEYIAAGTFNNLQVVGSGTTDLTLINNGLATIQDFVEAIKSIKYFNDAPSITYGVRKVAVTGWAGGVSSLVSTAELPIDNDALKLQAEIIEPLCNGNTNGSIEVSTTGGTAPYDYVWQSGQTGNSLGGLVAGDYYITIADAAGCVNFDTVSLSEPEELIATITYNGPPAICDTSANLTAIGTGGVIPYDFAWNNGVTTSQNNGLGAGIYSVTVTDGNGCQDTANLNISSGDTILMMQSGIACEDVGFEWEGITYFKDTLVCFVFELPGGCDSTSCLSLKINPSPQLELVTENDFCTSSEVGIAAGIHSSYQWSTGEITPSITTDSAGTFEVTVTNDFGCSSSASITVMPGIEYDFSLSNPTCFGDKNGSIVIDNVSGGNSPWRYSIDGINFFPDGAFENLGAGNYLLTIEDVSGCRKELPVVLEAPSPIFVEAGDDKEIKIGESVTLAAVTNIADPSASWQPPDYLDCTDCLVVNAQPLETIQYEIEVWDENGCMAKDSVTIFVDPATGVYIPNAFSPNGDGINDWFTVYAGLSVPMVKSLMIFNRWGDKVFENTNFLPNELGMGWDGTFKGKRVPTGVYVFRVELQRIDGKIEMMHGEVSLLR